MRTGTAVLPRDMAEIGTVPDRFQSHNVEMVEVIGGRFWKPYGDRTPPRRPPGQRHFVLEPATITLLAVPPARGG